MFECQNCEREFEEPELIDGEMRCPYCMSSDIIGGIEEEIVEENEVE